MPWIVVSEDFHKEETLKEAAKNAATLTMTPGGQFRFNLGAQARFKLAAGTRIVIYRGEGKDKGKVLLAWLKAKEQEPKGAGVCAIVKNGSGLGFTSPNLRFLLNLPKGKGGTWDLHSVDNGDAAWLRVKDGAAKAEKPTAKKKVAKASSDS